MTRMFPGHAIPGLTLAMFREFVATPVELDVLVDRLQRKGFDQPDLADHVEWLSVNDPRVVRHGKRIRRYTGAVDEAESA